jgi:uncharacterized protein (TIGR02246 family)
MSRLLSICAAILLVVGSAFVTTASYAGSPEEDVTAAYAAWDAAFSKADAGAIAAFYAEDAVFLPPSHNVIEGPAGVEAFFAELFKGGATAHKLELVKAQGDDTLLFGAAKWSAMGKDSNGADQPWGGIATHVFERQSDGSLKIKLHTFN